MAIEWLRPQGAGLFAPHVAQVGPYRVSLIHERSYGGRWRVYSRDLGLDAEIVASDPIAMRREALFIVKMHLARLPQSNPHVIEARKALEDA
jgi:hypothetical protein